MSYSTYSYFQGRTLYFSHTSLICKFSIITTLWTIRHLSTKMLFTSQRRKTGDTEGMPKCLRRCERDALPLPRAPFFLTLRWQRLRGTHSLEFQCKVRITWPDTISAVSLLLLSKKLLQTCWLKVSIKLLREERATLAPLARTHVEEIRRKLYPQNLIRFLFKKNC